MFDHTKAQYADTPIARVIWHRLVAYGTHGAWLGDFLEAVVRNDWKLAVAHADDVNVKWMYEIMIFLCNEMPSDCFGSHAKVDLWRLRHGRIATKTPDGLATRVREAEKALAEFTKVKLVLEQEGLL